MPEEIQAQVFAVGNRYYCAYGDELDKENLKYVEMIIPEYHIKQAELIQKEVADKPDHILAASARLSYFHSLEVMFALLGATIQAHNCPMGWMLKYKTDDLFLLIRNIHESRVVPNLMGLTRATWAGVADRIFSPFEKDKPELKGLAEHYGRLWKLLASEFLDEDNVREHNSLKHGLRIRPGGFSIKFAPEGITQLVSKFGSQYGSTFPYAAPVNGFSDQSVRKTFVIEMQSNGWNLQWMLEMMKFVSTAIHNIRFYLILKNTDPDSRVQDHLVVPEMIGNLSEIWGRKGHLKLKMNPKFELDSRSAPTEGQLKEAYCRAMVFEIERKSST